MPAIKRKKDRVRYYSRNILVDMLPSYIFRAQLSERIQGAIHSDELDYMISRVNFYNKVEKSIFLPETSCKIGKIPLKKSMYYYDFKEIARFFPKNLKVNLKFGDVLSLPQSVSFLKSRPSIDENQNGILMKMSKFRLYYKPSDTTSFLDKKPIAVWRGGSHNVRRRQLVRRHKHSPFCDVAFTAGADDADAKKFLTPNEQMAFRYIIAVEGNDVASNLFWTMASNSLCLMPRPRNESWLMESRLIPGQHYVELDENFENLEEKLAYYESHADEAQEIIRNANLHTKQFLDVSHEITVGILVLYKFFVATGQIEPDEHLAKLLWP